MLKFFRAMQGGTLATRAAMTAAMGVGLVVPLEFVA